MTDTTTTDVQDAVIPAEELQTMTALTRVGIEGVESRLQWLSNYNDSIEIETVTAGYVDPSEGNRTFRDVELLGGRVALSDVPYGYAFALFPVECANNAAALLLSATVDELTEVSDEMARSALTELTGMMVNGFFDEWANRFGEGISVSEPEPVHNTEREILRRTIGAVDSFGVYLAARVWLPNHGITGLVYLFPDTTTFLELVTRLDVGALD